MTVSRNTVNFVVDGTMFVTACGLLTTGLLIKFVLPAGSTRRGLALWGWDRHDWGDVHFWLAMTVIGLLLVHLSLHWQWVCTTVKRLWVGSGHGAPPFSRRGLAGVATLAVIAGLIGGSLWVAQANLHTVATGTGHEGVVDDAGPDASHVYGSTTLRQAAAQLGVEPADVIAALNLRAGADPDRSLGRLARDHGLRMREVRDALSHLAGD